MTNKNLKFTSAQVKVAHNKVKKLLMEYICSGRYKDPKHQEVFNAMISLEKKLKLILGIKE